MSKIHTLYQSVTSNIIAELEAGAAPWVKCWDTRKTNGLMPINAATGRAYSGINILILWHAARTDCCLPDVPVDDVQPGQRSRRTGSEGRAR